jgi:hypothetical protein
MITFRERCHHLWTIYLPGVIVAVGLFSIHTLVIYQTAKFLASGAPDLTDLLGRGVAEPVMIIVSFLILFITHLAEAAVWAGLFMRSGQFKDFGECMYFAGTSLTALGYGDLVLQPPWRGLGPIMATNGILMFGCSTAFLFVVIQHAWSI